MEQKAGVYRTEEHMSAAVKELEEISDLFEPHTPSRHDLRNESVGSSSHLIWLRTVSKSIPGLRNSTLYVWK